MAKPSSVNGLYAAHLYGVQGVNQKISDVEMFNIRLEALIFNKIMELCMNRFKWEGFPDTVDPRYLELELFMSGTVVFFDHPMYGYLALKGTGHGLDHYNNPTHFRVIGGRINRRVDRADGVPIYPNYTRTPDIEIAMLYARRISQMDVTIDINTKNARQPRVLATDENTRLTMENVNRLIDVGAPTIKIDRAVNPTSFIEALDMGVDPRIFDMLGIARTRVWNECMSLLGIKNSNQDKKERLVADEVTANDEQVGYMRAVNLNARRQAAEQISEMFPKLSITVDYSETVFTGEDPGDQKPEQEDGAF